MLKNLNCINPKDAIKSSLEQLLTKEEYINYLLYLKRYEGTYFLGFRI
jgi:hypothetical protein